MANGVINYDVDSKHIDVKKEMKQRGYFDYFTENGKTYYLPNTTLWKPNTEHTTAMADIKAVVAKLGGVVLQRAIALTLDPREAIEGKPHSE